MIANHNFTEYILKWIEMALSTCGDLQLRLHDSSPDFDMQEYLLTLDKLMIRMQFIYRKWCDYEDILDCHSNQISPSGRISGKSTHSTNVRRVMFDIIMELIEYLSSLGFSEYKQQ